MVEVKVTSTRNGVYIYFHVDYIRQLFGDTIPELITLLCGGREVNARFNAMSGSTIRYRVYSRYIPIVLRYDECHLVVARKV